MPVDLSLLAKADLPGIMGDAEASLGAEQDLPMLLPRDALVIRFVGEFHQATASQIREVLFDGLTRVPADRSLERLCKAKYLSRLQRRVAGEKGGSGAYVYQLGPKGWWYLAKAGNYKPATAINYHSIAVADAFLQLVRGEKAGTLEMLGCKLELIIGQARADIALEIGVTSSRKKRSFYLELEVTRKRSSYIQEKCDAYSAAWRSSDAERFPYVVFVAPDAWIASEISRTTSKHKDKELFRVCEQANLVKTLIA